MDYLAKENAGEIKDDTDPLAIVITCKNLAGSSHNPYETISLLSGSGNHKMFLEYLEKADLASLGKGTSSEDIASAGLNVVVSALGKVSADVPSPVKFFFKFADLSMSAQADKTMTRTTEQIANNSTLQNYLVTSRMQGTVSVVNGQTTVNCLGYYEEGLEKAIVKFNPEDSEKKITSQEVKEAVEKYCRTGEMPEGEVRAFLIDTEQESIF